MAEAVQIALASDRNMLDAALVVIGTAARQCSVPVTVHFMGRDLSEADRARLARLCELEGAALVQHELSEAMLAGAVQRNAAISLVAMARLFLPGLVSGRVVYLDCDVRVAADIAPLFTRPLDGALMGVVRDFLVLDRVRQQGTDSARLRGHVSVMGDAPVVEYFNSGVLLMDCDAINAEPGLAEAMTDLAQASEYPLSDQDYLNLLFAGRTHFLPLGWNAIWGRNAYHARAVRQMDWLPEAERDTRARIIHYTGPKKPWKPATLSAVLRGRGPETLRYRRVAAKVLSRL
ncbi:glycosyltransferase family 8 protein [Pseudooceanicola sediminis]|uniref:Glycosyltransferase family 8 protein n=1 Tax=Pseudooceanicola sediminis TaxID=2211117 RepID=A0A399J1A1_9RHOB|nr:glycosyltransferase family 8 protein [Pseudooceanicola sediminis]KAA2313402.1 glycosyltransferase family 8 protein [Puniceibacterium sp. HSS470]RII38319.1 glycosyltransferase family 8 protein [Pseudooceanicola sediminis]|tara:strand:+ start:58996 stop:59865 length:870 start_codon:yes stop_codon:yes gene_type:complete